MSKHVIVISCDAMVYEDTEILKKMDVEKVWINPDCGLKTRGNAETWPSLEHLVAAAKAVRAKLSK